MRNECERCGTILEDGGVAFICSYECNFCEGRADGMERVRPNRGGELRPRLRMEAP